MLRHQGIPRHTLRHAQCVDTMSADLREPWTSSPATPWLYSISVPSMTAAAPRSLEYNHCSWTTKAVDAILLQILQSIHRRASLLAPVWPSRHTSDIHGNSICAVLHGVHNVDACASKWMAGVERQCYRRWSIQQFAYCIIHKLDVGCRMHSISSFLTSATLFER